MRRWQGILLSILATFPVTGETLLLKPTADTALWEADPTFNFGAQSDLPAGAIGTGQRSRALFKFDLTSKIPASAQIQSTKLVLTVTRVPSMGAVNSIFELHRVLKDWGEGLKKGDSPGGEIATAGEATWRARFSPDQLWGIPGAQPGVDYANAISASQSILGSGAYTFSGALAQDVQAWLANPAGNFGWLLKSQAEGSLRSARRFAAREDLTRFPTLMLQYTVSATNPAPPQILAFSLTNQQATVRFTIRAGATYTLQSRTNLLQGIWTDLQSFGPSAQSGEATFNQAATNAAAQFYRIKAQP